MEFQFEGLVLWLLPYFQKCGQGSSSLFRALLLSTTPIFAVIFLEKWLTHQTPLRSLFKSNLCSWVCRWRPFRGLFRRQTWTNALLSRYQVKLQSESHLLSCDLFVISHSAPLTLVHLQLAQVNNEFQANKEPTIGAAFLTQKCRLEDRVLRYEIWDTAGQERFHSLAPMYYRNAQAAVVVYDVTKAASLEKAKSWVKELQRQANPNIVIALAGNKVDLVSGQTTPRATPASASTDDEDEADDATATPGESDDAAGSESLRQVPKDEALAYATEAGLLFTEISAKTGDGIVELFTDIGAYDIVLHKTASKFLLQPRRYQ